MTENPYIGLDRFPLAAGQRIEVVSDYPGSEVDHYHGMRGYVRSLVVTRKGEPCVLVRLEGIDGEVMLYPYEVMQEDLGYDD